MMCKLFLIHLLQARGQVEDGLLRLLRAHVLHVGKAQHARRAVSKHRDVDLQHMKTLLNLSQPIKHQLPSRTTTLSSAPSHIQHCMFQWLGQSMHAEWYQSSCLETFSPTAGSEDGESPGRTLREDSEASREATFSCRSLGTLVLVIWSALPRFAVGSRSTGLAPRRSSEYSASTGVPVFPATRACDALPRAISSLVTCAALSFSVWALSVSIWYIL